jgi:hypothetical protein
MEEAIGHGEATRAQSRPQPAGSSPRLTLADEAEDSCTMAERRGEFEEPRLASRTEF